MIPDVCDNSTSLQDGGTRFPFIVRDLLKYPTCSSHSVSAESITCWREQVIYSYLWWLKNHQTLICSCIKNSLNSIWRRFSYRDGKRGAGSRTIRFWSRSWDTWWGAWRMLENIFHRQVFFDVEIEASKLIKTIRKHENGWLK